MLKGELLLRLFVLLHRGADLSGCRRVRDQVGLIRKMIGFNARRAELPCEGFVRVTEIVAYCSQIVHGGSMERRGLENAVIATSCFCRGVRFKRSVSYRHILVGRGVLVLIRSDVRLHLEQPTVSRDIFERQHIRSN